MFFWTNIIGYNIQILCGLWKKNACGTSWWTLSHGNIPWFLWPFSHRDPAILPQTFHYASFAFFTKRCWRKGRTTIVPHPHPMPSLYLLSWTARKDNVAIFLPWTGCVKEVLKTKWGRFRKKYLFGGYFFCHLLISVETKDSTVIDKVLIFTQCQRPPNDSAPLCPRDKQNWNWKEKAYQWYSSVVN